MVYSTDTQATNNVRITVVKGDLVKEDFIQVAIVHKVDLEAIPALDLEAIPALDLVLAQTF